MTRKVLDWWIAPMYIPLPGVRAVKIFGKSYHSPGTSPGTLEPAASGVPFSIHLIDYTDEEFVEKELANAAEIQPYLSNVQSTTWVHVRGGTSADSLREIGRLLQLHPLALEDVANKGQRAKIEEYDEQLFIIIHLPVEGDDGRTRTEQVSIFAGSGFLVSFHDALSDPFEPVRARLRMRSGKIRSRRSDYLLYAVLDNIVDHGFPLLERYGELIEGLEQQLLDNPGQDTLADIHRIRRDLLLIRRMLWPQREMLVGLYREECPCIEQDTRMFLRDCYDHTVQIMDLLESYREMAATMLEVYISSVSNRLNESMRLLTIIATLFIPLTFIVGVYGMNFGNNTESWWAMPELRWAYGYPSVWLIMILVVGLMLYFFKRNRWM